MDNKEFGKELQIRTKNFAVEIIQFSTKLPKTVEASVVRNQVTKSGTSVGANYREANRARSKADFTNKIKISESEASETVYWLEIIDSMEWGSKDKIETLLNEANELLAIFTSIASKLNSSHSKL